MTQLLQQGQVEAHVSRLTNIRTQLAGYSTRDARAVDAIPAIDAAIEALNGEARVPVTEVAPVDDEANDEDVRTIDPDDLPFE
jgi:hypothetical protein